MPRIKTCPNGHQWEGLALPLSDPVRRACEILGLDPVHVANEGKLIAIVASDSVERALECLHRHRLGTAATLIGEVTAHSPPQVLVRNPIGSLRVLDEPAGAPLPRIC